MKTVKAIPRAPTLAAMICASMFLGGAGAGRADASPFQIRLMNDDPSGMARRIGPDAVLGGEDGELGGSSGGSGGGGGGGGTGGGGGGGGTGGGSRGAAASGGQAAIALENAGSGPSVGASEVAMLAVGGGEFLTVSGTVGASILRSEAGESPVVDAVLPSIGGGLVSVPDGTGGNLALGPSADPPDLAPEPGSLLLFGSGLTIVAQWMRRRKRQRLAATPARL